MIKKCLILECQKKIQRIAYEQIYYFHYQDGAITIHLTGNKTVLHCLCLKDLEAKLPVCFTRLNRNVIINLNHVSAYFKASQKVVMENGQEFDVSRRNIVFLMEKLLA
ncbi:LytTR family transcriptional regulator DNA-binding domain-containing protein [Carboxylicivirga sp. A043]|uniref:LytR/AlgR family response regulator transcription factor n=1 Tax=Carboxylicivirga litoralis TaxID=2816963 RepID=UPI0021CB2635|nr:LytTR family DNA-binding domain-containing protein [Carboxylicivirga sp. A043]MCU4156716.1 LytTR family transcriptional regulator DNA-binding domain-containing protein [Carboxylicivirga sp. A043]